MKLFFALFLLTASSLSMAANVCSYVEDGKTNEFTIHAVSTKDCLKKISRQLEFHEDIDSIYTVNFKSCSKNGRKCSTLYKKQVVLLELSFDVWKRN
jgi:hypothetical protein